MRTWTALASPECVARLRREVAAYAADMGFEEERLAELKIALSEIVTNAVVHGDREPTRPTRLRIWARRHRDQLVVSVADDGVGFSARTDSPGLGLGLPIAMTLADALEVKAPADGGTEVRMAFTLPG